VPKNTYVLEKVVKAPQRRGSALEPLLASRGLGAPPPDTRVASSACCCSTLSSSFHLMRFITIEKTNVTWTECSAFAPIFHFKLCGIVDGGA